MLLCLLNLLFRARLLRVAKPTIYGNTGPPVQVCQPAVGAVAGKRANPMSIAAVEGPLSTVIGEKGKELKTPRAAVPM
jgi:hypothetical protein